VVDEGAVGDDAGEHAPLGGWQDARVVEVRAETPRARTLRLALSSPVRHLAGQHYVVRLTAPDGYTASRSYSVASAPDDTGVVELTVERLDHGEVSTFLHDVVEPGDELEVRGPLGGWFVWRGDTPALLVGGGSGIVPLMAMLRHARATGTSDQVHLVVSVRSPAMLYYADELPGPEVSVVWTREPPAGDARGPGRLRVEDIAPHVRPGATAYVCGAPAFCDAASDLLLLCGVEEAHVRVERFGSSA
jgi:ferredoxin-NADP reductase